MQKQVFISYSSTDRDVAEAICETLEAREVYCWIAPRDVVPGAPYSEALIDAINQSSLVVLVFSSKSNNSPQVIREIERAVNKGVPIIPFRIENVPLSKSMEYFISTPHWLDALTPPREGQFNLLANIVQLTLSDQSGDTFIPGARKDAKSTIEEDLRFLADPDTERSIPITGEYLFLHFTDANGHGNAYCLRERGIYRIGRSPDNDIILTGIRVSRHHAFILFSEGSFIIVDGRIESDDTIRRSTNGILINDQRQFESKISDGSVIQIGENILICSKEDKIT